MLKLPTILALLICFVYSNNEHNVDTEIPQSDMPLPIKASEDNKNAFQTIKGEYVEEKKRKSCKHNKNRRVEDKDVDEDLFDSLPLTATTEQMNTANIGNKIVTSSIHGANYNYKNEKSDTETDNQNLNSKNCDCKECILEANKKVLQFEALTLGSNSNSFNDADTDIQASESESPDGKSTPLDNVVVDENDSDDKNNNSLGSFPLNNNTSGRRKLCNKGFNMNTRRRKCGKIDLSENLSTAPTTRRILPGVIENPNNEESEDNRLYQDSPQINGNDEMEMENRKNNFPNVHKVSNSYDIDLVHNMNINESPQQSTPEGETIESQLLEPTRGKGIYDMKDAGVMLLENSRVCYACSTLSDPTCWTPDKRTTVKYCQKGHKSCLTRSFKYKGIAVIIRDCGSNCVNGEEKYTSCSICHTDLCNGASTMYTTGIAIIVFIGMLFNTQLKITT